MGVRNSNQSSDAKNDDKDSRLKKWRRAIQATITESFFRSRDSGFPYRNSIGFLLGFIAALLMLNKPQDGSSWLAEATAAKIFTGAVILVLIFLLVARPDREEGLNRFAWGVAVFIILGFGFGALAFHYRERIAWPWNQHLEFLRDKETRASRIFLEALFLLGVIMGFFVVRNWSKEQKDFVESLTAVLGGAFIATIVNKIEGGPALKDSFAAYALGFTLSGALNLIAAARLTANYTNRKTITSRAILDFLYGSERAKTIDNYFLKNFEEDPNDAKARLTSALMEFANFARKRFAERMEARHAIRNKKDPQKVEQAEASLKSIEQKISRREDSRDKASGAEKERLTAEIASLEIQRQELEKAASPERCYQLLAISKNEEVKPGSLPPASEDPHLYTMHYRKVNKITEDMFRIAVSVRWQNTLEYIFAPGEYQAPFPYEGSVAGLALRVGKAIVMDRDRSHTFRPKNYPQGVTPAEIEQNRGLDEIDYLSYILVPVISRPGRPTENPVGMLHLDTKIFFATDKELGKDTPEVEKMSEVEPGTYSAKLTRQQLAVFANRLYEQDGRDIKYEQGKHEQGKYDPDIKYLEEITRIIVPVLELYLKCRTGAT